MNVVSLFSGVGGLDLGLERAGMSVVAQCEIDPHARKVLARHWPGTPIHDDVTTLTRNEMPDVGRVDLICGGSPCQDLSVAGRRHGLDGERSGLFWEQCRVAAEFAAPWVLWENVAGALSSNAGHDFAAVLWGLTGTLPQVPADGWRSTGLCVGPDRTAVWRMLDAQWFGVAQRRRRVFVVAGPGALCGPEVLALAQSVRGDPRPSRETRPVVAALTAGGVGTCGADDNQAQAGHLIAYNEHGFGAWTEGIGTLRARDAKEKGGHIVRSVAQNQRGEIVTSDVSPSVSGGGGKPGQGYPAVHVEPAPLAIRGRVDGAHAEMGAPGVYNTLRAGDGGSSRQNAVVTDVVRRLAPVECERLMGWPDDHTAGQADAHRYKQCGNGVVTPCAEWIGRNIIEVAS